MVEIEGATMHFILSLLLVSTTIAFAEQLKEITPADHGRINPSAFKPKIDSPKVGIYIENRPVRQSKIVTKSKIVAMIEANKDANKSQATGEQIAKLHADRKSLDMTLVQVSKQQEHELQLLWDDLKIDQRTSAMKGEKVESDALSKGLIIGNLKELTADELRAEIEINKREMHETQIKISDLPAGPQSAKAKGELDKSLNLARLFEGLAKFALAQKNAP